MLSGDARDRRGVVAGLFAYEVRRIVGSHSLCRSTAVRYTFCSGLAIRTECALRPRDYARGSGRIREKRVTSHRAR